MRKNLESPNGNEPVQDAKIILPAEIEQEVRASLVRWCGEPAARLLPTEKLSNLGRGYQLEIDLIEVTMDIEDRFPETGIHKGELDERVCSLQSATLEDLMRFFVMHFTKRV